MTYRAQAAELPFALPRPRLFYEIGSGDIEISAPPEYSEYVWSIGDPAAFINVTTNGVYQAWAPYGIA